MQSIQKQKTNVTKFNKGAGRPGQKKSSFNLKTVAKAVKLVKVGKVLNVKISALANANLGINEFTYGFPIYVGGLQAVNASLGDLVQVQVLKISRPNSPKKLAIAKATKVVKKSTKGKVGTNLVTLPNGIQNTVSVSILKAGPKGTYIAQGSDSSAPKFIVYSPESLSAGQKVNVTVTKMTSKYAFAKLSKSTTSAPALTTANQGAKFNIVLPKKAKRYLKHIVFQISAKSTLGLNLTAVGGPLLSSKLPTILFVKPLSGSKLGDKVQIQVVKAYCGGSLKKANIVIGKIVEVNPLPASNKKLHITNTIKQMLNSDMHYGEKAIRCNARMKNYVMYTKASKKPLIKKGRNVINLFKTRRCLNKALAQLTKYAYQGKTFLFVGTKKSASGLIARASLFSQKAFFVNTRWLGGMLTNWKTILKSISKIRPILKEKQIIIKDILTKRQNIKTLLMEKAFLLKKKSKLVIKKGKQLVAKYADSKKSLFTKEKADMLSNKRIDLVKKGQVLLEKRQLLLQKRLQLISQSQALHKTALQITTNSKDLFMRASSLRKQIAELKSLLQVSQQIQKIQLTAKKENKGLYTVSYSQYKELSLTQNGAEGVKFVIPNPPKKVLNKMVLFIKSGAASPEANSNISKKETAAKSKVLVLTSLLNSVAQVNSFASSIKASIKTLVMDLNQVETKLAKFQANFKATLSQLQSLVAMKTSIGSQFKAIRENFNMQRNSIRILKKKFQQIAAQKRFMAFLIKLKNLFNNPLTTGGGLPFSETVDFLMKKVVDPQLKYSMDSLYDSKLRTQTKKVASMRKKKWQRLEKYLGGISSMNILNTQQMSNTVAIIIGQQEEMNAVRECQKLGIKMFHVIDTNCNPGLADHFVPANDDSRNSIKFVLSQFLTRIRLAQKLKRAARTFK